MSEHPLKKHFEPDVPEFILKQASDVEKHLLKGASVEAQKNTCMIEVLISVEAQTTKTNGCVSKHDESLEDILKRMKDVEGFVLVTRRYRKRLIGFVVLAISVLSPLVYTILNEWVLKLFHFGK